MLRTSLTPLLVAAAWLLGGLTPARAEPVACQRTVAKEFSKFVQASTKLLVNCQDMRAAGAATGDCVAATASAITTAATRMRISVARRCGGGDHVCGTADDDPLASIGWGSFGQCPGLPGASCSNAIANCNDVGQCLACVGTAAVQQSVGLYYDALQPGAFGSNSTVNRCQRAIGKAESRFLAAKTKALQRCWDARLKGRHTHPCPIPGDGKAGARIATADTRARLAICRACGGADGLCGGGDDESPAAVGFVSSCPAVTVPGGPACGGSVGTAGQMVGCVACATEFEVDCAASLGAPGLAGYPAECRTVTTSTSTSSTTSTSIAGSTTSTSSTTSSTVPGPTTSTSSSTSTTSTSIATTTTTSTSSTTSTTAPACQPPAIPLGSLVFTAAAGSTNCGGSTLQPPAQPPFAGAVYDGGGNKLFDLGAGCLYTGGGNTSFPPADVPDGFQSVLAVSGLNGLQVTLGPSAGNGPADCTLGAGPGRHCVNGSGGIDSAGGCFADTDCGVIPGACLLDANCYFGPPLPVALPGPPDLSLCLVNAIETNVCGSADLLAGASMLSAGLTTRIYLTRTAAVPCPQCIAGACAGGERNGLACSGGIGARQTSVECLPAATKYVGPLPITLSPLTSGTSTLASANGLMCPGQVDAGFLGLPDVREITMTGSPLLSDLLNPLATTLVGTFCIPSTGNQLVDLSADLPGPGAVSLPGTANISLLP